MNVWKKRLIMFCIGCAIGSAWAQFHKGNIAAGVGFVVSAIYAIGWWIECIIADGYRMEAEDWETEAKKASCGLCLEECLADILKKQELKRETKSNDNN